MDLNRRQLLALGVAGLATTLVYEPANAAGVAFTHILGRPTGNSISLNLLATSAVSAYVEYGFSSSKLSLKTEPQNLEIGNPKTFEITKLKTNSNIYYRIRSKSAGASAFDIGETNQFKTAKTSGKVFAFTLQGDTHPERAGKMYNADLYAVTLKNVLSQKPDFHILLGDDFSIDPIIGKNQATQANVEKIYQSHRNSLSAAAKSVPLFLVNGNHEQAAAYLIDGTDASPAVLAGNARKKYFPVPIANTFYSADKTEVPFVGTLGDYYSWVWGDATFITLDPYWHSKYAVDNVAGVSNDENAANKKNATGASKTKDLWQVGLGDEQYFWLKKTLETSKSKYIFVFAHHVMGTGRGAVEVSYDYEWGGRDPSGKTTFKEQRPNWELPIHDLFVKHKVSAFFQGHDHIFCHQSRDGVIYQAVPNPADDTFSMFNEDAYKTGTKAANSGHIRVSVSSSAAKVDYFLAAREQDNNRKNLDVAHTYSLSPRKGF